MGALPHPDSTFNKSKPYLHPFSTEIRDDNFDCIQIKSDWGSFRFTIEDHCSNNQTLLGLLHRLQNIVLANHEAFVGTQ